MSSEPTDSVPWWFEDRRYRLAFGQMTDRTRDALLKFALEHPWLRVQECFPSRYYLGMYGFSNDPQAVTVEMHPDDAAFPRTSRTYAQLNAAPERVLAEMLREIEERLPTPSPWMAL
jgi:hypothetical protein